MADSEENPEEYTSKDNENLASGEQVMKQPEEGLQDASAHRSSNPMQAAEEILKNLSSLVAKDAGDSGDRKVLDPDHPLMVKFQKNLKEHLKKLHQETDEQLFELTGAIRQQTKENDQIGKQILMLQKELVRCKNSLLKLNKDHSKLKSKKHKLDKKVEHARQEFNSLNGDLSKERGDDTKLQKQMEEIAFQVVQLKEFQIESYTDASTMAHAMEKTSKQKEILELEKLRQDMLITRLEADQHNLQEKIKLYKSQYTIKQEELTDLRKVLLDAISYIESMHYEKVHLMQQWNYSILSLEKRDKTCSSMQDSMRAYENEMITLKMDITNHKKYVRKELEENEKLTLQLLHVNSDIAHLERNIEECRIRLHSLEEQYAFFDHMVAQTDEELMRLKCENDAKLKELEQKARMLEKASNTQRELNAEYMKMLHEKIAITKASQATEQLIKEKIQKIRELEAQCIIKEGEKAKLHLKIADVESHLLALEENLADMNREYDEKMKTIEKSEAEISKGHIVIEKKQLLMAELNNKLGELIGSAGGMELGPLEREIANIKKEINYSEKSRKVLEQEWLRFQKDLVSLTNQANANFKENEMFLRREAVLEEKKIRVEADINQEMREIKELMRSIERTQTDMERLNALLHQEKGLEQRLQEEAELLKGDFLGLMKEAELNYIKKENELEQLRRKRTKLLYKSVEAQRQNVLWEEKLHLLEETKKMLKSESEAEEVANLKGEKRRLQVRLDQIRREMEAILQLMEKAALKHASLYVQADLQCLKGTKKKSKQYLKTKTERLRRMINDEKKKLEKLKGELQSRNEAMFSLKKQEEDVKSALASVDAQLKQLEQENEKKLRDKWQSIIKLSFKHKKNKLLEKVKSDKYVCALRNSQQRPVEVKKIQESLGLMSTLINDVLEVHPELLNDLVRVTDHISVGLEL